MVRNDGSVANDNALECPRGSARFDPRPSTHEGETSEAHHCCSDIHGAIVKAIAKRGEHKRLPTCAYHTCIDNQVEVQALPKALISRHRGRCIDHR